MFEHTLELPAAGGEEEEGSFIDVVHNETSGAARWFDHRQPGKMLGVSSDERWPHPSQL